MASLSMDSLKLACISSFMASLSMDSLKLACIPLALLAFSFTVQAAVTKDCNEAALGIPCCGEGFAPGDNTNGDQEIFIRTGDYRSNCSYSCKSLHPDSIGVTESVKQKYSSGNGQDRNKCWCEFGHARLDATNTNYKTCVFSNMTLVDCGGGAKLLSKSPGGDMALCKDMSEATCERDFESLCPAGWHLCTPKQFNNRNDEWRFNWRQANAVRPVGVIYCRSGDHAGYAGSYGIDHPVMSRDQSVNCLAASTRPGCADLGHGHDCDDKDRSALCCKPSEGCGNGKVDGVEEDCDDGNDDEDDECLKSCTWKRPADHGISGTGCL